MSDADTSGNHEIALPAGSPEVVETGKASDWRPPWIARLLSHVPPGQFGRYLLVGVWNTVFGYGAFAGMVAVFEPRISHGYVLAGLLSNVLSITVAFLGYKWFVFKTKGNYLREWLRCLAVYSGGIAVGTLLLPVTVQTLRYEFGLGRSAPYVGGAVILTGSIAYNFWGHKRFSFRDRTTV